MVSLSPTGVGHFRGDQSLDALNRSNEEGEGEHSDDSQCRKFRDDDDDGDDDDEEEDDYEAIKSENRGSAVEAGNILQVAQSKMICYGQKATISMLCFL